MNSIIMAPDDCNHALHITLNRPEQEVEPVARKNKWPVLATSLVISIGHLVPGYGGVAGSRYTHLRDNRGQGCKASHIAISNFSSLPFLSFKEQENLLRFLQVWSKKKCLSWCNNCILCSTKSDEFIHKE
jgi:hypothetical protein